jgi:hypothetical protein
MNQIKEKLLKFDESEFTFEFCGKNFGLGVIEMSCRKAAKYQFNKDAKIISALLEIIEMQDKALEFYGDEASLNWHWSNKARTTTSTTYESDSGDTARKTLSETKQKLEQLIKGE